MEPKEKQFIALILNEIGATAFTHLKNGGVGKRQVYFINRIATDVITETTMLLGQFLFEIEAAPDEALRMTPGGTNRIYFPQDMRVDFYDDLTAEEKVEAKKRLTALYSGHAEHSEAIDNLIRCL